MLCNVFIMRFHQIEFKWANGSYRLNPIFILCAMCAVHALYFGKMAI